jgi:aminoglycoside 3-N-acetyltransferase
LRAQACFQSNGLKAAGREPLASATVAPVRTALTTADVRTCIAGLGLSGGPVCLHASLRSFGPVRGGADALVDAFLEEGCTLLVPSFSFAFAIAPPAGAMRLRRNGWDGLRSPPAAPARVYDASSASVDSDMGAIARAVVRRDGRERGAHPLSSFAAVGALARELIAPQSAQAPFAPLATLAERGGSVALAGVGLTRLTLLHLAEQRAGRRPFQRWALGADGRPLMVAVGGCSEGFDRLDPALRPLERRATVGRSRWRVLPAAAALLAASGAIRAAPAITHCGRRCVRCDDAMAGGPLPFGSRAGARDP